MRSRKRVIISLLLLLCLQTNQVNIASANFKQNPVNCIVVTKNKTNYLLDCSNGLAGIAKKISPLRTKIFWYYKEDKNKNFWCEYWLLKDKTIKAMCVDPNGYSKNQRFSTNSTY